MNGAGENAIGGLANDRGAVGAGREHTLIDQATGWLAGRLHCPIAEAAEHLAGLARETGISVAEAAALLIGDGTVTAALPPRYLPGQPAPADLPDFPGHPAATDLSDLPGQPAPADSSPASGQVEGSASLAQQPLVPQQPEPAQSGPAGELSRSAAQEFPLLVMELVEARARIETERREATLQMQQAILPTSEPEFRFGRFDIAVRYQPAQSGDRVGGDWYEARVGDGGTVLVTIGDVAGHGLTAAAGMARIGNALRGMTVTGEPPDTLLRWLNDLVCTDEIPERVASAAVSALDPDPLRIRWAQAGHPPPVLVRGGKPRLLDRPAGLLLGTIPGASYELMTEDLSPGDLLIFYTDGLIERRDRDIDEGLAELLKATARCQTPSATTLAADLATHLSPGSDDDICILVIHITP